MMIQISEPITLEKLLPLIQKLPKVEREQLRKSLEEESQLDAAILLYQEGKITLGRAAELARSTVMNLKRLWQQGASLKSLKLIQQKH